MAQHGTGRVGGNVALDSLGRVARIVDGQLCRFIPAEQLVHHDVAFFAAPEQREGRRRAVQRAADGAPTGDPGLVGLQHAEGELVVRGAVLFAHHAHDAVEGSVPAGISFIPVAVIGNRRAFVGIQFVRFPAEFAPLLSEPFDIFRRRFLDRRFGRLRRIAHQARQGASGDQSSQTAEHRTPAQFHCSPPWNKRLHGRSRRP